MVVANKVSVQIYQQSTADEGLDTISLATQCKQNHTHDKTLLCDCKKKKATPPAEHQIVVPLVTVNINSSIYRTKPLLP